MKKITITGTKGKTTISSVLAQVFTATESTILKVDTSGAYLNGKLMISKQQSQVIWDLVPTVAPGRFLYLANDGTAEHFDEAEGIAILEASLGCGTVSGLGYYGHNIGVFTNVFEDHIGSRPDLQSRADIGKSKSFVFSRVNRNGVAVFNADDDIVSSLVDTCKPGVQLLPFGLSLEHFDTPAHLNNGGYALTVDGTSVVLLHRSKRRTLFDLTAINWTFSGRYQPSIYNVLAITGALLGHFDMVLPRTIKTALLDSRLDQLSGRLTLLKNQRGVSILADYAHEKQSLRTIADLAHQLKATPENRVIGVLRLAWDRDEALIEDTANFIANDYDRFVIYDKIDGHWRQPSSRFRTGQRKFDQAVGKISGQFSNTLAAKRGSQAVDRVLREDLALELAAKLAQPGDVVVFIVNDDIKRSLQFVKDSFEADFV